MAYVVLVTVLILLHYIFMSLQAGSARGKANVQAPRMTGDEVFERKLRVQVNTLEQLAVTIPAMWMCAYFFSPIVAAVLGLAFFVGRILYAASYVKEPSTRGTGMIIGFLANLGLLGCSAFAAVVQLLGM